MITAHGVEALIDMMIEALPKDVDSPMPLCGRVTEVVAHLQRLILRPDLDPADLAEFLRWCQPPLSPRVAIGIAGMLDIAAIYLRAYRRAAPGEAEISDREMLHGAALELVCQVDLMRDTGHTPGRN